MSDEEAHLYWEQVGMFLVREGCEIVVDPNPDVEERVLRLFILGPALATLLRQRGRLVLHASVVAVDGEAVAFLGGSGWGKSTVAAAMYARGHEIVADDIAVLRVDEGRPTVFPGFPQLKVWPETALFLNEAPERLPRLHPRLEKRAYRLSHGFISTPLPLKRIYVLANDDDQRIQPLSAQEALVELIRHSYGARGLHDVETPAHFLRCASLAGNIALRSLRTYRSLPALPSLVRLVEEDLAEST